VTVCLDGSAVRMNLYNMRLKAGQCIQ
jgi:hypothetical protein